MTAAEKLINWYKKEGRDLPWRNTTDPYLILISEIMLQQTQVSRVIEYFDQWLKQFPDWNALAKAPRSDVLHAWAGLGYNRRALALHEIAKQVAENGVPDSEEEWLKMKGIGPYTAAALTIFSLRHRAEPIDTNIRRVLGRVFYGITFPRQKLDKKLRKKMRKELLDIDEFYDIPQALFDLANSHCLKIPSCANCPIRDHCKASEKFVTGRFKVPKKKQSTERIQSGKQFPDRIYRGRILKAVRDGESDPNRIAMTVDEAFTQKDTDWFNNMIHRLENDGLITVKDDMLYLPD